jgi:hypothetical protein
MKLERLPFEAHCDKFLDIENLLVHYCTNLQGLLTYLKENKLVKIILAVEDA